MMNIMARPSSQLAASLLALACLLPPGRVAAAADAPPPAASADGTNGLDPAKVNDYLPNLLNKARQTAGVDEKLDAKLPLDLEFTDSTGKTVKLGDYFTGKRPVVIQMAYYRCPKLCGEISKGMVRSMKSLAGDLTIGEDFEVLTISFDSRESPELAGQNKEAILDVMKRVSPEQSVRDGWHCMVGDDLNIKRLTDAMGYKFGWVAEAQQYSHPAVLVIATPDGRVSRYLYGVTYAPDTMRLTLTNASEGTITPSLADKFILSCFSFDPSTGKYTATAYTLMRLAGVVTVIVLGSIIGFMLIMEKRGKLRRGKYAGTPIDEAPAATPTRTAFSE